LLLENERVYFAETKRRPVMYTKPDILNFSDEKVLEEARRIRYGYHQKRNLRYHTKRDHTVHSESVAEHLFALIYLLEYFLPLEDPEGRLDYRKLVQIILYHDFPEIPHGDIPYVLKTEADEERERLAAKEVYEQLPLISRDIARASWDEYELRESPEALFAYALDKIEPVFEIFDAVNEKSCLRLRQTYESHVGKKLASTEMYPYMRKFVTVLAEDMRTRGVFWTE
jgi:5'-deoxynucleotidase YfbR-like HD superfamily hydrolase